MLLGILLSGLSPTPPYNPLNDVVWQTTFVLAIVTIISAFIPSVLEHVQRGRREITYSVVSDTLIPSTANKSIVTLRIWNSGTIPIEIEDYEEEIEFNFYERQIVAKGLLDDPEYVIREDKRATFLTIPNLNNPTLLRLNKFMLQKGEAITIFAEVIGGRSNVTGRARIKENGKMIEVDKRVVARVRFILPVILGLATILWAIRSLSVLLSTLSFSAPDVVLIDLAIFILVLLIFFGFVYKEAIKEMRGKGLKVRW